LRDNIAKPLELCRKDNVQFGGRPTGDRHQYVVDYVMVRIQGFDLDQIHGCREGPILDYRWSFLRERLGRATGAEGRGSLGTPWR